MRIRSERELLKVEVRKQIIDEIKGPEENTRRREAYKRHMCYRDQTRLFVVKQLLKQFSPTTVQRMDYAITNISFQRKIIDKLARVYSNGVERVVEGSEELTNQVQDLAKVLDMNRHMKQVNRQLKGQKNALLFVKPCPYESKGVEYMGVKLQPLSSHLYSVVEDYHDREKPLAVVLSNYEEGSMNYSQQPAAEGRTINTVQMPKRGDGKDQVIADAPEDELAGKDRFVFWSDSFHFTTNEKGEIIDVENCNVLVNPSEEDIANPIEELPFVDFSEDRDGSYWAYGGDDLVDASILLNCLISNYHHISVTQGYGQMVMIGKDLPQNVLVGPDKAITLKYEDKDDPAPSVQFLNANAPLSSLRDGIEMHVSLLLTTNKLSTTGISMQLQGSMALASGVALMIDKSESQEDVIDQQQQFRDKEPDVFRKMSKWIEAIKGDPEKQIDPELEGIQLSEDFWKELYVVFEDPEPIVAEGEHLENLKKRKDLGISTMIDIIKRDNVGMTDDQAKEKLAEIMAEKLERANQMMGDMINLSEGDADNEGEEKESEDVDNDEVDDLESSGQ